MGTPIPLLAVSAMVVTAVWFTRTVMRDEWVKNVAKGGWLPLVRPLSPARSGAVLIADRRHAHFSRDGNGFGPWSRQVPRLCPARHLHDWWVDPLTPYHTSVLRAGLTGAIGAIHANRLSTSLHTHLHPHHAPAAALSPAQSAAALFTLGFPCLAVFLGFISWAEWIDLSLGWTGWAAFAITVSLPCRQLCPGWS